MTPQTGPQILTINISQEVKAIRQWNLGSSQNIVREIFLLKNHAENGVRRLVPDLFLFLKKNLILGESKWPAP